MMTAVNFDKVNLSPDELGMIAASINVNRPDEDDKTLTIPA